MTTSPMLVAAVILIFSSFFSAEAIELFPGETWTSGEVDLGNGGDALFYYLFKARNPTKYQKKLVIWLGGGPGCGSALGIFAENGPYLLDENGTLYFNKYSWNEYYDILFVDQPVGTIYATAKDEAHYCRNDTCVANNFDIFMKKFI